MRYIAAYLLCKAGGTDAPTTADVTKVLAAAGVDADAAAVKEVVSGMEGKDLSELIESQKDRIFVGGGGGGGGGAAAAAADDAPKEEEKQKEEEEEVDFSGGMDMFGGGGGGGGDY